jgi:transcription antitermination factor NusG
LIEVIEEFFPCYLFARFDGARYYHMIKYTRGVRRIVGDSQGYPRIVDDALIETIKSRSKDGYVSIEENQLHRGDKVMIKGGPFDGFMGLFVQDLKPRERVLVLLNTLNYEARIDIYRDLVVKASPTLTA